MFKSITAALTAVLLSGCAHSILITPDLGKIVRPADTAPIARNVGYYIADGSKNQEVNTPGGGGDKITYVPYRDAETGFYTMLGNVFGSVTKLKSPQDQDAVAKHHIDYIITPQLLTSSSSPSPFTWPPTDFTVELSCNISDASGRTIANKRVIGVGKAEYDEFKKDFGLSGKRAMQDALLKMQSTLLETPELRQ